MRDLSKRITRLPEDKRALLDALLRDEGVDVSSLPMRSCRSPGETSFPLSFAQQRMWFLNQLTPDDPFYNMTAVFRIRGDLNHAALTATFNAMCQRHEVLRTTFHLVQGQPVQMIGAHRPFTVSVEDLRVFPDAEHETRVRELAVAEGQRVFDLTRWPLLRVRILRLSDTEHVLLQTMHHIVADGWSLGVLQREIATLYASYCGRPAAQLPELPIQYADFAQLQREWLRGPVLNAQLDYWRKQLEHLPPTLRLPTDRPRPVEQTFYGRRLEITLPGELRDTLKRQGQRQGGTLFMVLLGAFQLLLSRYSGQDDIAVGSPIANRNRREIEDLIGFFANSLVMRTDLAGNPTFEGLLARVRDVTLGAYANQDIPFEMLVEHLQPTRNLSHNPLFQVVFALQNAPLAPLALEGLDLQPLELDNETTRFDLELHLWDRPEELSGYFVYNTDLFDDLTMRRMLGHFCSLLAEITARPERPIDELLLGHDVPVAPDRSLKRERALIVDVEAALRQHPLVDDCVVLARDTATSARALVAYVIWTANTGGTMLRADLFPLLPTELPPLYLVPITALPLTVTGHIDEAALMRVEVIDTALAERWEARLQAMAGIEPVAVMAREMGAALPPLHLADLISDWPNWEALPRPHAANATDADEANQMPDWFFRKTWRRTAWRNDRSGDLLNLASPPTSLIFLDRLGLGKQVVESLAEANGRCVIVEIGTGFARLDREHFRIEPSHPEHYRQLMTAIADENWQIDQILHLWTYDDDDGEIANVEALAAAQHIGLYSLLGIVQSLVQMPRGDQTECKLVVISSFAQSTSPDDRITCQKSTMIGLLKTIALELPWLCCRLIDLEPDADAVHTAGDDVWRELST